MLTISPEELISAGRIAADAVRVELNDVVADIMCIATYKRFYKDKPEYVAKARKAIQRLKRRKAKLEKTLLILKHIHM